MERIRAAHDRAGHSGVFFSRNELNELLCPIAQNCVLASHAYLASKLASCTDGTVPSEPPGTRPKRDIANAFAAAHASSLCHRLTHARRASACSSSGKSRTLAQARDVRNSAVSLDQRPPTSAPRTTKRALPPSPASSGYVLSLRRRASSKALPLVLSVPRLALPPRCREVTPL